MEQLLPPHIVELLEAKKCELAIEAMALKRAASGTAPAEAEAQAAASAGAASAGAANTTPAPPLPAAASSGGSATAAATAPAANGDAAAPGLAERLQLRGATRPAAQRTATVEVTVPGPQPGVIKSEPVLASASGGGAAAEPEGVALSGVVAKAGEESWRHMSAWDLQAHLEELNRGKTGS